jgi:hypothetical protein
MFSCSHPAPSCCIPVLHLANVKGVGGRHTVFRREYDAPRETSRERKGEEKAQCFGGKVAYYPERLEGASEDALKGVAT